MNGHNSLYGPTGRKGPGEDLLKGVCNNARMLFHHYGMRAAECVLWLMVTNGSIMKCLQITRIKQYDRGRLLQCLKVNITLQPKQLPACRRYLKGLLGDEICLTISELMK